jgi:hypothetical protein
MASIFDTVTQEFPTTEELRDAATSSAILMATLCRPEVNPKGFEEEADDLDLVTAALELEEGGREAAEEGLLRAIVRERLTPDYYVEIPGLGCKVGVYL